MVSEELKRTKYNNIWYGTLFWEHVYTECYKKSEVLINMNPQSNNKGSFYRKQRNKVTKDGRSALSHFVSRQNILDQDFLGLSKIPSLA